MNRSGLQKFAFNNSIPIITSINIIKSDEYLE